MAEPQTAPSPQTLNDEAVGAAKQGDFDRSIAMFRAALAADPGFEMARRNLMGSAGLKTQALMRDGQLEEATTAYLAMLAEVGTETETRRTAAGVLTALSRTWQPRNADMSVTLARRAAGLMPDDGDIRANLEKALFDTKREGQLSDYTAGIAEAELGRHIFIACFPKSGSSYLKNLLNKLTGHAETFLTYAFFQNEQELYLPYLLDAAKRNTVTQQHMRPTVPNIHIFQAFGIRPIVLVRNIHDVLLSWKEFLDVGAHINTFFPAYASLDEEARFDLVIADRLTWYLSFFAGWKQVEGIDTLWLTYEEMTADTPAALKRVSDFYGLARIDLEIEDAIEAVSGDKSGNRFNKGVAGRGGVAFTEAQKARIQAATAFYPGVDFSMIGL